MSEDTVTIHGIELNVEDLEEALDQVTEDGDDVRNEWATVGSVAISGDGFNDGDVYVANLEEVTHIGGGSIEAEEKQFTNVRNLRRLVEDSTTEDFSTFVQREFLDAVVVNEGDDTAYGDSNIDLDITTSQTRDTIGSRTGGDLDESDDVSIGYITYGRNGGGSAVIGGGEQDLEDRQLLIGLSDERDE